MARSIRAKIFGITMHRPPVYADERFDCQGLSVLPKKLVRPLFQLLLELQTRVENDN